MDVDKLIKGSINTIEKYKVYYGVKLRGSLHYHNFVDLKWVLYLDNCCLSTKSSNIKFNNLKLLLLYHDYKVPNEYEQTFGTNGDTPFILSPEQEADSKFVRPENFGFGKYLVSDTRRRKYRIKVEKMVIVNNLEIFHLNDVMLDLHYQ